MDKIKCPKCGEEFPLTDALLEELKEDIKKNVLTEKEESWLKQKSEFEDKLSKYKGEKEKAEENELKLRKEKELLEDEKRKFELEKQRQLDEEREKIRIKAQEEQVQKDKYKFAEYEKRLSDTQKSLDEATRKAAQTSQQLQGEVQELDLQDNLQKLFLTDSIEEIKKGENGADIRQIVKTQRGTICGIILWESKRTKVWSESWIDKLKEDVRKDNAYLGVIISEVLPTDFKKEIGEKEGIWITTPFFLEPLANLLRKNLYDVAKEKAIINNKQGKAEELYDFITGHEFSQQVERMVEIYLTMRGQIAKERASTERQWKEREMQIDILLGGVSGIYGSMQGIAGPALPAIKLLESGID